MYVTELLILPLILFLLSVLWFYSPARREWLMISKIPGPPGLPLIGNLMQLQGTLNQIFNLISKCSVEYNNLFKLTIGKKSLVFVSDPSAAQLILCNKKHIYRDRFFERGVNCCIGSGLISNRDEEWRIHRKILFPLFSTKTLRSYTEIFGQKTRILLDNMSNVADGRNINILHHLSSCATDALCKTVLGIKSDSPSNSQIELMKMTERANSLTFSFILCKPWLQVKWLNQLFTEGREAEKIKKFFNNFFDSIIDTKLQAFRSGRHSEMVVGEGEDHDKSMKDLFLLDELIEASEKEGAIMSPQEIKNEIIHLFVTGTDTVTVALSTFFVLMGIHPDVQEKVARELDGIFGDDLRLPTEDDLSRMEYLERAIKETMRMFPLLHFLPRELVEDVQLPCGRVLPGGTTAFVFSYRLHRNEQSFPEPERFLPDRWLPDRIADIHPCAYLPFGAGPRNCIGQKYARILMAVISSSFLRRFTVTTRLKMEDLEVLDVGASAHLTSGNYEIQLNKRSIS